MTKVVRGDVTGMTDSARDMPHGIDGPSVAMYNPTLEEQQLIAEAFGNDPSRAGTAVFTVDGREVPPGHSVIEELEQ